MTPGPDLSIDRDTFRAMAGCCEWAVCQDDDIIALATMGSALPSALLLMSLRATTNPKAVPAVAIVTKPLTTVDSASLRPASTATRVAPQLHLPAPLARGDPSAEERDDDPVGHAKELLSSEVTEQEDCVKATNAEDRGRMGMVVNLLMQLAFANAESRSSKQPLTAFMLTDKFLDEEFDA